MNMATAATATSVAPKPSAVSLLPRAGWPCQSSSVTTPGPRGGAMCATAALMTGSDLVIARGWDGRSPAGYGCPSCPPMPST